MILFSTADLTAYGVHSLHPPEQSTDRHATNHRKLRSCKCAGAVTMDMDKGPVETHPDGSPLLSLFCSWNDVCGKARAGNLEPWAPGQATRASTLVTRESRKFVPCVHCRAPEGMCDRGRRECGPIHDA
jgi:hypothetical protein